MIENIWGIYIQGGQLIDVIKKNVDPACRGSPESPPDMLRDFFNFQIMIFLLIV